jgi:hypothetical protein
MRLHGGTRNRSDVYTLTSDHEERAKGSHERFVCSKHVSPLYFLGLPKYKCQSAQSLLPLSIIFSRTFSYNQACALWKVTQLDLSRMQLLTTRSPIGIAWAPNTIVLYSSAVTCYVQCHITRHSQFMARIRTAGHCQTHRFTPS